MKDLIDGYLDGCLTTEQEAELNAWIKASPENARVFAEAMSLHDRLHNEFTRHSEPLSPVQRFRYWRPIRLVSGMIALVAVGLVILVWGNVYQPSAAAELNELIDKMPTGGDRTYVIKSLDPSPLPTEPRQPPIDGALLSIRPPNQYVLERYFPDGRRYLTGFDGERNWDVPPESPVRLSRDPLRFRWPLPGHQHGIPFSDLRSDLVELRDAYDLKILEQDSFGYRGLLAVKKSREHRGPNRVELWYDAKTGVIHRMVFRGLPKARGGPDSVAVELIRQHRLAPDYFQHESHHHADRKVIEED